MASRRLTPRVVDSDPAHGSLGRLILGVGREMRTAFERRLAPLGITSQQAELLHRAHLHGEVSPNELTHLLMTDGPSITRLVDRLEAKGLIERRASPDDRRSVHLVLTREGRGLIPRIARIAQDQKRRLFIGLSVVDEQRLHQLLERVLANARSPSE